MKKSVVLILLLLCPFSVLADWFYSSQEVEVTITIAGSADIVPTGPTSSVDYVNVNLSLFPKSYAFQQVDNEQMGPTPTITGESALYTFNEPQGSVSYLITADVTKQNSLVAVDTKIPFPIQSLPSKVISYTQSTPIIDSDNAQIIKLASQLVEGEDDLYKAVFALAKWTKENIKYNLSTLTADAAQSASWVLTNRKGVCDELTSLFIAMLRSLGIPAKFVTGSSYTNSPLFPENWGLHGWSEVYFPGYGWVPFDVTYGQYGFVDPTHIKLKESKDPSEASTRYTWLGRDVDLSINDVTTSVELKTFSGRIPHLLQLESSVVKDEIGFNSYNAIELVVTNVQNFYVATELQLSLPSEVNIVGDSEINIILGPKETKKVFWIFHLDEEFNQDYIYTFPGQVGTSRNQTHPVSFRSSAYAPSYTLTDIGEILDHLVDEQRKQYSSNVTFTCKVGSDVSYDYEQPKVACVVKNTGNRFLNDLHICFDGHCEIRDVGITREVLVEFPINTSMIGQRDVLATVRDDDISKASALEFELLDTPLLSITEVNNPPTVEFSDEFSVDFVMEKNSYSTPQLMRIILDNNGFERQWTLEALHSDKAFSIPLSGSDLVKGENNLMLVIEYHDRNGRVYTKEHSVEVQLVNVSGWQQVQLWMNYIKRSVLQLSLETVLISLFVTLLTFIIVVFAVFRRRD